MIDHRDPTVVHRCASPMVDVFHDPPGGAARDVEAAAAAERRRILINSGTERLSTVRAVAPRRPLPRALACPLPFRCSHRPPRLVDHVPVLVLSGDVRAHARRTLPLHVGGAAAPRRGERRRAAVARSGRVDGAAAGAVSSRARAPRSGRSRARAVGRGASPPADRRSYAPRCARRRAGCVTARRLWPPVYWICRRVCAPACMWRVRWRTTTARTMSGCRSGDVFTFSNYITTLMF